MISMKRTGSYVVKRPLKAWLVMLALASMPVPASGEAPYAVEAKLVESTVFNPGVVSIGSETGLAFSPDGGTVYFVRQLAAEDRSAILVSRSHGGEWTSPVPASFSRLYNDHEPFVSVDGERLFFASDRPTAGEPQDHLDLWYVDRHGDEWGEPQPIAAVNTTGYESYPSVSADGTLYFGSIRPEGRGRVDLYRSTLRDGVYLPPEPLADLNTDHTESDPYISPDQSYLIFAIRLATATEGDLYVSHFQEGRWAAPRSLGEKVNSSRWDYTPLVSPDGKYFFFTRSNLLHQIELEALDLHTE